MGTLIDSSVLIAWERNQVTLEHRLADSADEDFGISAITASELLHGVHRASTPAQRRRREAFVEGLLSRIPVIAFDAVVARIHARMAAELRPKAPPSVHTISSSPPRPSPRDTPSPLAMNEVFQRSAD